MGLIDQFEKLINEHGSSTILREHLALLKAEQSVLERKNTDLQTEKKALQSEIDQLRSDNISLQNQVSTLQSSINSGYVCDHCGSPQLIRVGNRPDPTFGDLGVKQAVFRCADCRGESAFTP